MKKQSLHLKLRLCLLSLPLLLLALATPGCLARQIEPVIDPPILHEGMKDTTGYPADSSSTR